VKILSLSTPLVSIASSFSSTLTNVVGSGRLVQAIKAKLNVGGGPFQGNNDDPMNYARILSSQSKTVRATSSS
jgi:hypothetical protein